MKRIKINGSEIAYRDVGAGQPIVFLHAFPLNQSMWDEQVTAFTPNHRVITFDWRGFGESEIGSSDLTMPLFADDLAELLGELQIDRAAICGLSMGGYAALAFHRKYSHLINALILCDTRAAADTEEAKRGRYEMADLARSDGTAAIADRMIPRLLGETTLQSSPSIADRIRKMIESASVEGIAKALIGMAQREDSTDLLPLISCPTLIIAGNEDKLTPPNEAEKMKQHIKTSELTIITAAGHLSNIEQTVMFNQAIGKFLSQL